MLTHSESNSRYQRRPKNYHTDVTNMIEETVGKFKDQLEEMNKSINTLSSSAAGSESDGGKLNTQFIVQ